MKNLKLLFCVLLLMGVVSCDKESQPTEVEAAVQESTDLAIELDKLGFTKVKRGSEIFEEIQGAASRYGVLSAYIVNIRAENGKYLTNHGNEVRFSSDSPKSVVMVVFDEFQYGIYFPGIGYLRYHTSANGGNYQDLSVTLDRYVPNSDFLWEHWFGNNPTWGDYRAGFEAIRNNGGFLTLANPETGTVSINSGHYVKFEVAEGHIFF